MSIDLDALETLCNAATDGPWFYNSYSAIFSKPKLQPHDDWFDTIPEGHTVERNGVCPACGDWKTPTACGVATPTGRHGCRYFSEDYDRDPLVAHVPSHHGDTAIGKRVADAELIAAARTALPELIAEVRTLREQLAEARQIIRDSNEAEDHTTKLIDQMYAEIRQHRAARRDQVLALCGENQLDPDEIRAICAAQPAQAATQGITPTPGRSDAHGHHSGPREAAQGKGGEQ